MPNSVKKPPLGIKPRRFVSSNRLADLCEAVLRYKKANMSVPVEWLEEMGDLCRELQGKPKKAPN